MADSARPPPPCVLVGFESKSGPNAAELDPDTDWPGGACCADGPASVCPGCGRLAYLDLQSTDYVERPMLWCNGCGARLVLDVTLDGLNALETHHADLELHAPGAAAPARSVWVSSDEAAAALDSDGARHETCGCGARPCVRRRWLKVPCLWIARVIPSNLGGLHLTRDPSADEIAAALSAGDAQEIPAARARDNLRRAGLLREEKPCDPDDPDAGRLSEEESLGPDWRLSLACRSYDVAAPAAEYPAGADFAHDGIHVYVECELADGSRERLSYWGD